MKENIKVLAVRQPWASLIACNYKDCEVRSQHTYTRGRIAIYASRSEPTDEDMASMEAYFTNYLTMPVPDAFKKENLPMGKILATVDLLDSDLFSEKEWKDEQIWHLAPDSYFKPGKTYGWYLCDVEKLDVPIDYKMPKGCVVWANAEVPV